MTAHTPRILTDAETSLLDAFAASTLAGEERTAAIAALKENGLPTRRVEAFHYTDLRALLSGSYRIADKPSLDDAKAIGAAFPRLVKDAAVLHFRDGYYFDWEEELPDGVSVTATLPAAAPNINKDDAVGLINTAFANDGVTVEIAPGAQVNRSVGLAYAHTGAPETIAATRFAVNAGAGSRSTIAYRAVGKDGVKYMSSSVVNLSVEQDATVNYLLAIEEGDAAQRLAQLNVKLAKNATLNLFILNVGGKLVRQEINFDVEDTGANLNISGINLIGGDAHMDITSRITHHAPGTDATETFRNVATGRGRGVFQGQINVRQQAQLTDARMACNTLLLSDECDFSAKPELEIFADDVQCAHGATVTDLEDSYMFYLMARGISETTARRMLIKAFVAELLEELEDGDLAASLEGRIDNWMEHHV